MKTKYDNYKYNSEVNEMLKSVKLNIDDEKELALIYLKYKMLGKEKVYEPIIKDLYIFTSKLNLSTDYLAHIYNVGIRTIQMWLKDLSLNRSLKESFEIKKNYLNIEHENTINKELCNNFNEKRYCLYRFLDKDKNVLYIGKCVQTLHGKSHKKKYFIRERLIQHFSPSSKHMPKSLYLNIKYIEVCYPDVQSQTELDNLESALISFYERNYRSCYYNKDLNLVYEISKDINDWQTIHTMSKDDIAVLLTRYQYTKIPEIEIINERLKAILWILNKNSNTFKQFALMGKYELNYTA